MKSAKSLMDAFKTLLNYENLKTSQIMYDATNLDNKVSMTVNNKDENGIVKMYTITIETTIPPSDIDTYNKKSDIYKEIFDK